MRYRIIKVNNDRGHNAGQNHHFKIQQSHLGIFWVYHQKYNDSEWDWYVPRFMTKEEAKCRIKYVESEKEAKRNIPKETKEVVENL